jgi:hypothetical protein
MDKVKLQFGVLAAAAYTDVSDSRSCFYKQKAIKNTAATESSAYQLNSSYLLSNAYTAHVCSFKGAF